MPLTASDHDSEASRRRRRTARHAFTIEIDGEAGQRRSKAALVRARPRLPGHARRRASPAGLGSATGSARFSFERRGVTELDLRYDVFYATVLVEKRRRPGAPPLQMNPQQPSERWVLSMGRSDHVTVPEAGLRFTFRAPTPDARNVRTMLNVTASAAPVEGHPAVRLTTSVSGRLDTPSSLSCFEAMVQDPPFEACTAMAGSGWDDGNARDVVLTIDNLAGEPLSVDLRIVVMDPLEH